MGIKDAYREIYNLAVKTVNEYETHYLKYDEGAYDALNDVLEIIEKECPEVLEVRDEILTMVD